MNPLDRGHLRALVQELAAQPDMWLHLVRHEPDQRVYELLRHDADVMVWLICWMQDHDTGFHDHDISAGAVAVARGQVREERLRLGSGPVARTLGPGEAFDFEAADIHRVLHAGHAPAVTINAYSPPLCRMGSYLVEPGGALRRFSVSCAEELRPLIEVPSTAAA